jgi:hypothetical protein
VVFRLFFKAEASQLRKKRKKLLHVKLINRTSAHRSRLTEAREKGPDPISPRKYG